MYQIKKIFAAILFFILLFTSTTTVFALEEVTEVLGGRYKVEETLESNALWYGVQHRTDIAQSSTSVSGGNAAGLGGGGTLVANQFYPQHVNILEVPSRTDVRVVTWQTTTPTKWNLSTVRAIARDYEANHPGWKVIGAINGDFFDINANRPLPYQTNGVQVSEGDFFRSVPSNSTVGFTNNGTANSLIGGKTVEREIVLTIYDQENNVMDRIQINRHNSTPQAGEVALYNANWNQDKQIVPVDIASVIAAEYFVVRGATKALAGATNDFYGIGMITDTTPSVLGEGDFAILSNNASVNALLSQGVTIRAQYEIIGDYQEATSLTGAGITLLKDGTLTSQTDVYRHPRTMIGVKEDGTIIMGVIDGRQPDVNMYGATQEEMAAMMRHYGAVEAYNLDGGGSSTMLIREGNDFRVVNSPSDGRERTDANAILIVALDPVIDYQASNISQNELTITANITNAHHHDVAKLLIRMNNQTKEVQNGSVTFDNLLPNREYLYEFIIENEQGERTKLITQDKQFSAKRLPYLLDVTVERDGTDILMEAYFYDPDNAVTRSSVRFGGSNQVFLIQRKATLRNIEESILEDIAPFLLNYRYDLNDNTGHKDVDVLYPQAATLRVVMQQIDIFYQAINNILG